jgi:hypothetical protein
MHGEEGERRANGRNALWVHDASLRRAHEAGFGDEHEGYQTYVVQTRRDDMTTEEEKIIKKAEELSAVAEVGRIDGTD